MSNTNGNNRSDLATWNNKLHERLQSKASQKALPICLPPKPRHNVRIIADTTKLCMAVQF